MGFIVSTVMWEQVADGLKSFRDYFLVKTPLI